MTLSAAAGLDYHLGEGLQHEAVVIIREEDGKALHLARHAARLGQLQTLLLGGQDKTFHFKNHTYFE